MRIVVKANRARNPGLIIRCGCEEAAPISAAAPEGGCVLHDILFMLLS